jgi:hypothetical protein
MRAWHRFSLTDGLTTFKATLKFNNVGQWEIQIPVELLRARI